MFLSTHDIFTGLITISAIAITLFLIETLIKAKKLHSLWGRKLLHCIAICMCTWCIDRFENRFLLAFLFLFFFFILFWVVTKKWLQVNSQLTFGIALFPLAFSFLLFLPSVPVNAIAYAGIILAFSDAIAGLCGNYWAKEKIIFLTEPKSLIGFMAFYISGVIISFCYFGFQPSFLLLYLTLPIVPALTELFSYRGSDNFTVPFFTALWIMLVAGLSSNQLFFVILYTLLFILLSFFAVYKKWLTVSGAAAACWMALFLYTSGGLKAFVAPGIFLISGSLLSKLNKQTKEKNGRNAKQVFANGIVGISFLILYSMTKESVYLTSSIISFCISMADSVSSEIGFYFKGNTYDIFSLEKTVPGVSGGVSIAGTLAGLAGAFVIATVTGYVYELSSKLITIICVGGFSGMLADSVLGSLLQAKYETNGKTLSDEPQEKDTKPIKGFGWCTNDVVNLLSNLLTTTLIFYILKYIT